MSEGNFSYLEDVVGRFGPMKVYKLDSRTWRVEAIEWHAHHCEHEGPVRLLGNGSTIEEAAKKLLMLTDNPRVNTHNTFKCGHHCPL